ncbi:MAG: putative aminopeptidase [Oceanicoccus sp.]|jgi:predicted aminopeptidase
MDRLCRGLKTVLKLLLLTCLLFLAGCQSLGYYSQLVEGQWSVWWQRQAIDSLLNDSATEPSLKARLHNVKAIRQYAVDGLFLPDNDSYRYFADLKRPFVVWNVFATEEFSVEGKRWCFPVAGCVSYRGYFTEKAAKDYAGLLDLEGYDTYVAGIKAYSTLGWFGDPVLNTFLYQDEVRLAGLIFHELAHQLVYVAGDTEFNESFATTVEITGISRWLGHREAVRAGSSDTSSNEHISGREIREKYLRNEAIHQDFVKMILSTRSELDQLYSGKSAEGMSIPELREEKQNILSHLIAEDYSNFKARWNNYAQYDKWVTGGASSSLSLNNAKLSTVYSYQKWVPVFQMLLASCDNRLTCFYNEVKRVSLLRDDQRLQYMQDLADST